MAGPFTGAWRAAVVSEAQYTGALKQGTGINPVHAIRDGDPLRTNGTKLNYPEPNLGPGDDPASLIDSESYWPCPEDSPTGLWGYNSETGLSDRPRYGVPDERAHVTDGFPSWGGSRKTKPAGTFIRSVVRGALVTLTSREVPSETVTEGWRNKAHGIVADSVASSDAQLVMNTSDTQRYKMRTGSQSSGRASEFNAPVPSRVVGQKRKVYSGGQRHHDMMPYQQDVILRPFLSRQAGTGYQTFSGRVNSMYTSNPLLREVPQDPYAGDVSPSDDDSYGYVSEDGEYF